MRGMYRRVRHACVGVTVFTVALGGLMGVGALLAPRAAADPGPIVQRSASTVTADALPTVQIDGVVWDQKIVGDTVYAGGEFANARPAGAAPKTNLTPRSNLLAYNIRTGALITSFAPVFNGKVKALAASPDGKRLYVGGSFTTVNGANRYRLAAFDTATGALVASFAPSINATVTSISVTDTVVYAGGGFNKVKDAVRPGLAAFSSTNGALLGWAPTVDNGGVNAVLVSPDKTRVIVAGSFSSINGSTATGLGAVDASTAALLPFAANTVVRNYGSSSAMLSLSTDGTTVYSGGYWYGGTGNFEGVLAADPNTGAVKWLADCHGDTYGASPVNGVVYTVSHHHYCSNIGGFPDTDPRSAWYRADAFTTAATGTVAHNGQGGYADFYGKPAPSLVNWFPNVASGTFTGQSQGGWTTTGNSEYVVQGGEFPSVNGTPQQGLVRFAVPALAPKKDGPRASGTDFTPSLLAVSNKSVKVKWRANWDRDDQTLRYELTRADSVAPIYTTTQTNQFWNRPTMSFTDSTVVAGQTYRYRIAAIDPDGNRVQSGLVSITVPATVSPYLSQVVADGASDYWRMSGTSPYPNYTGSSDLTATAGVTGATGAGAISGDTDGAATFNGATGAAATTTAVPGPNTFTVEAWFKTSTTSGGKIVGFGNSTTGNSSGYDRHVYMDDSGRLTFGVYNGTTSTLRGATAYNDGQWHHAVAQLSPAGMAFYVDGVKIGSNAVTSGQDYSGYWRVGSDNLGSWPDQPSSNSFNGSIDEVAIYPTALSAAQVKAHYQAPAAPENAAPQAAFTSSCTALVCSVDASSSVDTDGSIASYAWDFGDNSTPRSGKIASHAFSASGSYDVKLTVTDNTGATDTATKSVTIGAPANQAPTAAFTSSSSGLTASLDGSSSTDADGTIASYAWDFGDGATGTGKTSSHSYAGTGSFTVSLKVTDDGGATKSLTKRIVVAPGVVVADAFDRTASKWGTADQGGAWTLTGSTAFSTNGTTGNVKLASPGAGATATLSSVSQRDVNMVADVNIDTAATGSGTYTTLIGRRVATSDYRMTYQVVAGGQIRLNLTRTVNGTASSLKNVNVSGLTATPGESLRVRFTATGSGTTALSGKVWKAGTPEPAAAQITATDATASLQASGAFAIYAYLGGSATTFPVTVGIDNLFITSK